jgi:hypothetical protein
LSENPEQPRDGWPAQPPRYTGAGGSQARSGQAGYAEAQSEQAGSGRVTFGQGEYEQDGYGQGGNGLADYGQASYQQNGYPQNGYRQDGYPQNGYRQDGYPRNGYQQDGYQQDGYQRNGYQRNGNPQGGYQQDGYLRNGYLRHGSAQRVPRPRRRRRRWIALASTLVVLLVLFFVADQVAKAYAQNMIASKLQSSSGLSAKPNVTIEGFPFLTQLLGHDIRTIDISASNVQEGRLDISSINATATGVHITSGFNGATIDRISGTALITFADLASAAGAPGVTITADPKAGPNTANVSVGPFSATATVTQTGPSQITVKIENLPSIAAALIGQLPDYTINVPKLPAGLQLQSVAVTNQGVVVHVAAQDTTLSQ